jgi:Fur family ferric uptake transcriptional regulator
MSITKDQARALLKDRNLRATAPRLAVMRILADSDSPLSHSDVLERLGDTDWDPATIYRNLIKLRDAGIAPVVSRADGIARYVLVTSKEDHHAHAHFVCDDCGQIACLPQALTASFSMKGPWAASIRKANVQLRGECPDCRRAKRPQSR